MNRFYYYPFAKDTETRAQRGSGPVPGHTVRKHQAESLPPVSAAVAQAPKLTSFLPPEEEQGDLPHQIFF